MTGTDPEYNVPLHFPLDGNTGPAPRLTREQSATMLSAAMLEYDRMLGADAGDDVVTRLRPRVKPWAAAAGVVLMVAGGVAAHYLFDRPKPAANVQVVDPGMPREPAPRSVEVPVTPASEVEAAPSETAAPEPAKADKPARGAPEDLLQKANQQRAAGHFREAAQTYAQVYERFPKTLSAYAALVAGGSLEAEHLSNPTHARKLFEQALRARPNGALDLEARQGLSTSLRDLEDRPAERKVLQALITAHPDSPAARRAQVRLREIGAE
ncbi:MAG: hypothetical protein ABW321_29070 [Polyangiales bacterium]